MSNEAKFTAGPWEATTEISMNDRTVCKLTENTLITSNCYVSEDLKADAHLIAAAPEMYALLDEFSTLVMPTAGELYKMCDKATALIAKARGDNNEQ